MTGRGAGGAGRRHPSPAGDSGTPLATKLGIREGSRVALVHAPPGVESMLDTLPPAVRPTRRIGRDADVVVAFFVRSARLRAEFARLRGGIHEAGGLWIAWPKRASGVPTDLTEDVVREVGLTAGLVDNKVCAVDATWSALRLVVRRADRASGATPRR